MFLLVDGFGDDADVGDAGLAEFVDDRGEGAKGNGLIGTKKDGVVGMLLLLLDLSRELVNVDGTITEIDVLVFVDGDDKALLDDFFDGVGLGNVDFDAGLENRRSDHEDDEEDQDDIDERNHVDVGERGLRGFGELRHGAQ